MSEGEEIGSRGKPLVPADEFDIDDELNILTVKATKLMSIHSILFVLKIVECKRILL